MTLRPVTEWYFHQAIYALPYIPRMRWQKDGLETCTDYLGPADDIVGRMRSQGDRWAFFLPADETAGLIEGAGI